MTEPNNPEWDPNDPDFPNFDPAVEDARLSGPAFRLYYHLARLESEQHDTASSLAQMARVCLMDEKTIQRALEELIGRNMVKQETWKGPTAPYVLTDHRDWR